MSKPTIPLSGPWPPSGPAPAGGAGATSGEGADTALQAMLRKRRQQAETPNPAAPLGGGADGLGELGKSSA